MPIPSSGSRTPSAISFWRTPGDGRFADATDRSGPGFALVQPSHGLAAGDYDNDGDLDLLISNLDGPPNLLRNDSDRGSWLTVALEVPLGGGTVIGTRVEARVGDRTLVRDVSSSESFLSVNDPRLHFGLGNARSVDRLEVLWADGTRTILTNVEADRLRHGEERAVGSGPWTIT